MTLTTSEVETLRLLRHVQLLQLRKAGNVGMRHKLATYRARLDVLDRVLASTESEEADEVARVDYRMQEGRY